MRTLICAATATIFLGLGMALLLQATQASSESRDATLEQTRPPSEALEATLEPTRPPPESVEATLKPTPTPFELQPILKAHYASADAPDVVSAVTMPIVYRQVRTVSIIEPTEAAPKNPSAPPAETSRTDYHDVEPSPRAAVDEDRSAAAPKAKTTAATQDVTSPQEPREEDVSSSAVPPGRLLIDGSTRGERAEGLRLLPLNSLLQRSRLQRHQLRLTLRPTKPRSTRWASYSVEADRLATPSDKGAHPLSGAFAESRP